MTFIRHETAADLANERALAEKIAAQLEQHLFKLEGPNEHNYRLDYVIHDHRERVYGMVECKHRNVFKSKYPTLVLSLHKWMKIVTLSRCGIDTAVAVQWTDQAGIYWYKSGDERLFHFTMFERKHNAMGEVYEPVVHIPTAHFIEIK